MNKIGVAVIGVGAWGKNHARVYRELDNANLIAVCDINAERAKYFAEKFNCAWTTDYEELLNNPLIEAISVCTPTTTHYEVASEALEHGKHVLVEKPMCGDVLKAKELVKKAQRKGVILSVGFIERFNPGVKRVKELIEKGEIGEIVLITSRRLTRWPERITDVGVVKDTAIHDIDLFRYLSEDQVTEVFAIGGSIRHKLEDYVQALIRAKNCTGFIEANWLTPRKVRKLIVTGVDGIIHLDYLTQEVLIEKTDGVYSPAFRWIEPLKIELEAFINAVAGKSEIEVTGQDGVLALEIAEAIIKSMKEGRSIRL